MYEGTMYEGCTKERCTMYEGMMECLNDGMME